MRRHAGLVLIAACGRIGFDGERPAPPDARVADVGSCDPGAAFGAAVRIGELSGPGRDRALRLMPDELSGYYASERDGGDESIYVVSRGDRGGRFTPAGEPAIAAASQPAPAADGTFALFERASDIWIAAREGLEQFAAIGVASELSTAAVDREPYVQPTGAEVYFASDRTGGNGDLYHTLRVGNAFVVPIRIAELASVYDEGAPVVSADGRELVFRSDRPAPLGGSNIYVAERATTDDAWGAPVLVLDASSDGNDEPSWLSLDGCRLYLTSDRGGSADIYVASRVLH